MVFTGIPRKITNSASSYVKLAEVYFVENNAMGAWKDIGYNAPNGFSGSGSQSTNFTYGASTYQATTRGSATWGAYKIMQLSMTAVPIVLMCGPLRRPLRRLLVQVTYAANIVLRLYYENVC